jgi:cytoskeletal protein RodZ
MPDTRKRRPSKSTSEYYVDGNVVRKIDVLPERQPREPRKAQKHQNQAEINKNREIARKNQERALRLNLPYTLFLIFSVIITVAFCIAYLSLQNDIMQTSEQISDLKSELSTLTNENVALEERINSSVDLSEVYQKAVGEFGMTAITEGQIYYYSNENQDYVKQYGQIPTND